VRGSPASLALLVSTLAWRVQLWRDLQSVGQAATLAAGCYPFDGPSVLGPTGCVCASRREQAGGGWPVKAMLRTAEPPARRKTEGRAILLRKMS